MPKLVGMASKKITNQTSARFLLSIIEEMDDDRRRNIAFDIYIKSRSYAILNKTAFVAALVGSLAILIWPVLAVSEVLIGTVLSEAVTQTAITGFTGLAIYFYLTSKRKQTAAETLLRTVAFSERPVSELGETVAAMLQQIDIGLQFRNTDNS